MRDAVSRAGLALASAGLFWLSFPNADLGFLGWIAFVPLLLACRGLGSFKAASLGMLCGFVYGHVVFSFMFTLSRFGPKQSVFLGLYLGLYPAVWCAALPFLSRSRVPVLLSMPALWVCLDWVLGHAGFVAFPWAILARTQHRDLAVLQIASLTGEAGVTFLVAMASVALADTIARRSVRPLVPAFLTIAVVHAAGLAIVLRAAREGSVVVAAIQPCISREERRTAEGMEGSLRRLEAQTRAAAASHPALIVWPETSVRELGADAVLAARLSALATETGATLVVGAAESAKFTKPETTEAPVKSSNAAYVLAPGQPMELPYRKMLLVPFGEYVPADLDWPAWLAPKLNDLQPGARRHVFTTPTGLAFAPLICWENLFAEHVRLSVRDGARLLVQLTNDNWFGETAAPRQHNLASVLRAVENRTPMVIASNTGPSAVIDATGRVVAEAPGTFTEAVVTGRVAPGSGGTFYTRAGDWFTALAAAATLAALFLRRRRSAPEGRA